MIIYGLHPVLNFIKYKPQLIKKIYISRKIDSDLLSKFKYQILKNFELDKLLNTKEHQGIACEISHFPFVSFDDHIDKVKKILILDHIEDPRNVGAILRNACAFGMELIIIPKDRACDITPSVIKTSAGSAVFLNIAKVTNINNCIRELKNNYFKIYGLEADGQKELSDIKFSDRISIVLGSEGKGIKELTKKSCDEIISISFDKKASSLNVASASAIVLYKVYKDYIA